MTMNNALHPKSDVDRLYLARNIGGRGIVQVEQTVEEEKRSLAEYCRRSKEKLLQQVVDEKILTTTETKKQYKERVISERKERWLAKPLHGRYHHTIDRIADRSEKTWQWVKMGTTRIDVESTIFAAQEQALTTNVISTRIHGTTENARCRLCKEKDETIDHLTSGCTKIAQTDYKQRHDNVAKMIHWSLCRNNGIDSGKNWYRHNPEKVMESGEGTKILWDFRIQTDRKVEHNTPDIVVIGKDHIRIIDIAIPGDSRIIEKEAEKIEKYQELGREMVRLWRKRSFKVIPIVVGALGAITTNLERGLQELEIAEFSPGQLQKSAIFGTTQILKKYLRDS